MATGLLLILLSLTLDLLEEVHTSSSVVCGAARVVDAEFGVLTWLWDQSFLDVVLSHLR